MKQTWSFQNNLIKPSDANSSEQMTKNIEDAYFAIFFWEIIKSPMKQYVGEER